MPVTCISKDRPLWYLLDQVLDDELQDFMRASARISNGQGYQGF
jgi:hypothetical protein